MKKIYNTIDLFAGAGGLSLGFIQSGRFKISAAFENNPAMQKTYRMNHPDAIIYGDVSDINFKQVARELGGVDVIIGGPPCQGFSNANRQKNRMISQNNKLVKQFIRAIREIRPEAFLMENVSMLRSDVHKFFLEENDANIVDKYKIETEDDYIKLLDKKHYFENAERMVDEIDIVHSCIWESVLYQAVNAICKQVHDEEKYRAAIDRHRCRLEKYIQQESDAEHEYVRRIDEAVKKSIRDFFENKTSAGSLAEVLEGAIAVQRYLRRIEELHSNSIIINEIISDKDVIVKVKSVSVKNYIITTLTKMWGGYTLASGVLHASEYGAPQKRSRFILVGIKKTAGCCAELPGPSISKNEYRTVWDAIGDLQGLEPYDDVKDDIGIRINWKDCGDVLSCLRDSDVIFNHVITKTTKVAMERFKALRPGDNFHSLEKSLKTNTYTDITRTQNAIYQRLQYDRPCGTVTNVRKAMWVHPSVDRAISIREAARLQTFPDSFVFYGTKDQQYQQIGNAVPPILSKQLAYSLAKQLDEVKNEK